MAESGPRFEDYLLGISPEAYEVVTGFHDLLAAHGYGVKMQVAKSGYVVSFLDPKTKKTVVNLVTRKKGPFIRLYGDHVGGYLDALDTLPGFMADAIEKSASCKRLLDPAACSSRCAMGYAFTLRGNFHQKCRYGCFMFLIDGESGPHIRRLLEREIAGRAS